MSEIPFYRRPKQPPKQRRVLFVAGKIRGSFVALGVIPGLGPARAARMERKHALDEAARARGVPVFDRDASLAELGTYLAPPRRDG